VFSPTDNRVYSDNLPIMPLSGKSVLFYKRLTQVEQNKTIIALIKNVVYT